jgi:hypothetical protein
VPAYSELELRYARPIANGVLENDAFRSWLLAGTKLGDGICQSLPVGRVQAELRSQTMKNPYWFNYWCGKDARCACRIGTGIETDILIILDCPSGRRLGLHIEIKRPGEHLGNGQAESYSRRAECWATPSTRPITVLPHQDYLTMLVCGRELERDPRLRFFDKVIFHDKIADQILPYPELELARE